MYQVQVALLLFQNTVHVREQNWHYSGPSAVDVLLGKHLISVNYKQNGILSK